MRDKVRIAIVGCGAVVQHYYVPALRALEKEGLLRVDVLLDPSTSMRERVKRSFPAARELQAFEELQCSDAELVVLASPPALHAPQGIELLRQGRAVLCEKPLAASFTDAQALIEAAAAGSSILAAGMLRRFFPATQAIRELLLAKTLGEIVSLDIQEGNQFRWPIASPEYFTKRSSAGGVLMDVGAHALDLMVWWLGEPVEIAYEDDSMGGVEANCRVRCRFSNGALAAVRLSRDCELSNRYVLRGTRGEASWQVNEGNRLELCLAGIPHTFNALLENSHRPAAHFERSFIDQILNVLAAVRGEEPLHVPASEALASLRVIDRCYASRTLIPMGWLDAQELSRAMQLNGSGT